jgi:hypothetical protein
VSELRIGTYGNETRVRPGDEIAGRALWILDKPARAVEIRLFWYTQGKGTRDVAVVDRVRFENPSRREQHDFRFSAPDGPYSFSGVLISLSWALELIVFPSKATKRLELTLSPSGYEVFLHKGEEIEIQHEGA